VKVKPEYVIFDELTVRVRIMKLRYELMNKERGTALVSRLQKGEHVEVDDDGRAWGSYLRARVTINATEPLMRCVSV
jgi:hypothetical protein